MPTYSYRCRSCQFEFEAVQSMMDDALTDCQQCDGTVMRIIQPTGIQFKGSGFYINDSKPASKKND